MYSALKKCPNLVLVKPHYEEYVKYSKLVNEIYKKYTDRVEKFSIDESFLDVTESTAIFGTPYEIAYKIKEEIKSKYNLTISVGVSFNKTFAKLGSDLKKPDAITVISFDNYKEKIYKLPVNMLLYVGKNTTAKLNKLGIKTIEDLALSNKYRIIKHLGKLGEQIYNHANGIDNDPVKFYYEKEERKSISKGITFESDINDIRVLEKEFIKLSSDVSFLLRKSNMRTSVVSIVYKDAMFVSSSRQRKISFTNSFDEICKNVIELIRENYKNGVPIRYICVGLTGLKSNSEDEQLNIFNIVEKDRNIEKYNKNKEKATQVMDRLKDIYGDKIDYASTINLKK